VGVPPAPLHVVLDAIFGHGKDLDALQMAARAFVMFFIALALVRVAGMRAFGHKSAFDAIIVIVLGAVLSRAIIGASPFWHTVAAASVLVVIHRVLAVLGVKSALLDRLIKGTPKAIYRDGLFDHRVMLRRGISRADVDAALREHGIAYLADVDEIYVETSGKLSIIEARRSQLARRVDRPA
jgi:uncharacterized membrane protein YcaP (DUF421 family)